jgi:hypothetical protein
MLNQITKLELICFVLGIFLLIVGYYGYTSGQEAMTKCQANHSYDTCFTLLNR